jgi:hypothetical protein
VSNGKRQASRNRAFRLELLESRAVLSAVGVSAHHLAEVSHVVPAVHETITGSLSGHGVVSPTSLTKGKTTFNSSGNVIGSSTFDGSVSYSANKSHNIRYTKGVATLANSSGDVIDVSFTGAGPETGTSFTYSVKGPVKGGAGTFARAAGTFTGNGSVNRATGAFSIDLTINLKRL